MSWAIDGIFIANGYPHMFRAIILTLFPELFPGPLGASLTGKALEQGLWSLETVNIRDFGLGRHQTVDDTPYGGGAGMVMRPDVVDAAIARVFEHAPHGRLIYLTPRGRRFDQRMAQELTTPTREPVPNLSTSEAKSWNETNLTPLIFLCGRYEAIDERVIEKYQPLELSLGDFVMTGGEPAALAMLDACVRLLPGVVGEPDSLNEESFGLSEDYALLLEHPHYTKPPVWQGAAVPETLLSGDHANIARWRHAQSETMTKQRRPDLWEKYKGLTQ